MFTNKDHQKAVEALIEAVKSKQLARVRHAFAELEAKGGNINSKTPTNETALHIASLRKYYDKDILEFLLTHSPNFNLTDKEGWTPLTGAFHTQSTEAIRKFTEHALKIGFEMIGLGAGTATVTLETMTDENQKKYGGTLRSQNPFQVAELTGKTESVKTLREIIHRIEEALAPSKARLMFNIEHGKGYSHAAENHTSKVKPTNVLAGVREGAQVGSTRENKLDKINLNAGGSRKLSDQRAISAKEPSMRAGGNFQAKGSSAKSDVKPSTRLLTTQSTKPLQIGFRSYQSALPKQGVSMNNKDPKHAKPGIQSNHGKGQQQAHVPNRETAIFSPLSKNAQSMATHKSVASVKKMENESEGREAQRNHSKSDSLKGTQQRVEQLEKQHKNKQHRKGKKS